MITKTDSKALFAEIVKFDDDQHIVYGKVADDSPDLDGQIADRGWLRREVPQWFKRWGNIRKMHHSLAAGVGQEFEEKDDGFYLEARIIDSGAWEKVKASVYKGFSIGIKNPVIRSDSGAPCGRIIGGSIVEVSLVDHLANENARFLLVKAADDGNAEALLRAFNERDSRYKGRYSRSEWARVGRRLAEIASENLDKRDLFHMGRIIAATEAQRESPKSPKVSS